MKNRLIITGIILSGLLAPTFLQAQITNLEPVTLLQPLTTTDLTAPTTPMTTTSLTAPVLTIDPAYFFPIDPALITPTDPDATTPPPNETPTDPDSLIDPAVTDPNTGANTVPTDTTTPPPTDTTTRPTDNPPAETTPENPPSILVPGTIDRPSTGSTGTFVPRQPITPNIPPTEELPPVEECPLIEPTPENPNPTCPETTPIPVIPQIPYLLLATPFLAVLLLWGVLSYMAKRQSNLEHRFAERHLRNQHSQTVNLARQQTYREFIDFLSASATTTPDRPINHQALEQFLSRTALIGSPEVNEIGQKIQTAFVNEDRQALKPLLKDLAKQIKLEL